MDGKYAAPTLCEIMVTWCESDIRKKHYIIHIPFVFPVRFSGFVSAYKTGGKLRSEITLCACVLGGKRLI